MKQLSKNWLTDGHIDFEYKRYVLLAYLQQVSQSFQDFKLYPNLSELIQHYQQLHDFRSGKQAFGEGLKKDITGIDLKHMILKYQEEEQDSAILKELDEIVDFALPQMEKSLGHGKERYEEAESNMSIFHVGIVPRYKDEGFLMLSENVGETSVYRYQVGMIELLQEKYRSVQTTFIQKYKLSMVKNYYAIRKEIINEFREFDSPSTIVVESKIQVPIKETFLPVAKRSLIRYLANVA